MVQSSTWASTAGKPSRATRVLSSSCQKTKTPWGFASTKHCRSARSSNDSAKTQRFSYSVRWGENCFAYCFSLIIRHKCPVFKSTWCPYGTGPAPCVSDCVFYHSACASAALQDLTAYFSKEHGQVAVSKSTTETPPQTHCHPHPSWSTSDSLSPTSLRKHLRLTVTHIPQEAPQTHCTAYT